MYEFRPIELGNTNIIEMANLLSEVFPETKKFTSEFLNWQYVDNPHGKVVGFNAYVDGDLVAHYATIPVLWKIHGELKKGLLSLNTATHKNHRGKKLFTQLAEKSYKLGKDLGYEFVIGVANANSSPGFIKKLDFKLICPLDAYLSISSNQQELQEFNSISAWDAESLFWRFQNPEASYSKTKNSVFSKTHIPIVKSIMYRGKAVSALALRPSKSILKLHIGHNCKPTGLSLKIPRKRQPSPLNLIYRALNDHKIPSNEEICFRLMDFDAY
tara:strand:- start:44291 stop:45103 length:813 start_codon:yes stop_codon:yes gene_type:complete